MQPSKGRRSLSAFLLLALLITAGLALTALYAHARFAKTKVAFVQAGLTGVAVFQVEVNCGGPDAKVAAGEEGTIDLGWLPRQDLITVQARAGGQPPFLEYHLFTDGHSTASYKSAGERRTPPGVDRRTRVGRWLVYRTYSTDGREVVHAGCITAGVPPNHLTLVSGDRFIRSELRDHVFDLADRLTPILLASYFVVGLFLAVLGAVLGLASAFRSEPDRRIPALLWGCLVAIVGFSTIVQWPSLRPVLTTIIAVGSGVLAVWWVRADLARWGATLGGLTRLR